MRPATAPRAGPPTPRPASGPRLVGEELAGPRPLRPTAPRAQGTGEGPGAPPLVRGEGVPDGRGPRPPRRTVCRLPRPPGPRGGDSGATIPPGPRAAPAGAPRPRTRPLPEGTRGFDLKGVKEEDTEDATGRKAFTIRK